MPNAHSPNHGAEAGQAAVMGALAVLLLGLSVLGGMRVFGPTVSLQRQQAGQLTMQSVQKALELFVARNDRLPCPADGTLAQGAALDGAENCALSSLAAGVVPWRALGLSPSFAIDAYNNRLGYAVSSALSTGNPYHSSTPSANDAIQVTTCTESSCTAVSSLYAYVLISFGPDGAGSYNLNGSQLLPIPPTSAPEHYNTQAAAFAGTASFFVYPFCGSPNCSQSVNTTSLFDDSLLYETSSQLCQNINGSRASTVTQWFACSANNPSP